MSGRRRVEAGPPRVARWLLERLGYLRSNPALAGDLLEEFESGRSRGWYWRQAAMVIVQGAVRNAAVVGWYGKAVCVGLAAEAGAAYALWRVGWPRQVEGVGWGALESVLGLAGLVVFSIGISVIRSWMIGGRVSQGREEMFAASSAGLRTPAAIVGEVTVETFVSFLAMYCWQVAMCGAPSRAVMVGWQMFILVQGLAPVVWLMLSADGWQRPSRAEGVATWLMGRRAASRKR